MKDFLEERGVHNLYGSKDTTPEAFKRGLIENGEAWMGMINSRNLTSHTYDEGIAAQIAAAVVETYFPEFPAVQDRMVKIEKEDQA